MNRFDLLDRARQLADKYEKTCNPGDGYGHELVLKEFMPIPEEEAFSKRHPDESQDSIYAFFSCGGEIHCGTVNGWDINPTEFTDAFLEKFLDHISDENNFEVF